MRERWWAVALSLLFVLGTWGQTTTVTHVEATPSGGTITSTQRLPDYARRDAIENGIDDGVAAGISLYERHEALNTLHNEERNQMEGLYQSDYEDLNSLVVLTVPEVAAAFSTPAFHSQTLGETWQEFVSKNPKLQANVTRCAAKAPPKESRKHQVYDPCAEVRYMQNTPNGSLTMTCRNADFMLKDVMCSDFDGEVKFAEGELVSYKDFQSAHWKDELMSLMKTFGRPSGVDKDGTSAIWRTPAYSLAAERVDGGVAEVLETGKEYIHTQAEQKKLSEEDD